MPTVTSPKDPTNQARTRKRATSDFNRRLRKSKMFTLGLFSQIPKTRRSQQVITNQTEIIWDYDIDAAGLESLRLAIEADLDFNLETEPKQAAPDWWYSEYTEQSYRAGALSENANIAALAAGVTTFFALSAFQVTSSPTYLNGLTIEIDANYGSISGLSDKASGQAYQVILAGINGNKSPREIRQDIIKRFSVAESDAKRIVDTSINRANNNSRAMMAILYRESTGLNFAVLHISALLTTTRFNHARRHGRVYTPEAQNAWWDSDSNRFNCHCSIRVVLVDENGKVVQNNLIKKTILQRKSFFGVD